MDYVLFGIQGSGKGTQGTILAQAIGANYFETGARLRELSQEDSELGKKVKSIIESGKLVPTEVVMEIVEDFAHRANASTPIIFDGIPRSEEQRVALEALLKKLGRNYIGLFFKLDRDAAIARLTTRRLCPVDKKAFPASFTGDLCPEHNEPLVTRSDDTPESITTRLDLFEKETMPIIEKWKAAEKIIEIDASPAIDEVTKKMLHKL
ncbi:adenylate kinase [Candidatus Peregrinibacteria bacterium CG11_big_fil_rev_8_21_14_0_20_46_8]|nr:MAG: adenylate kinase [Candidatus Peregrinibacteria bacterium CG11_big_fil_rev_8_21_14_0_20_46_8]